MWWLDGEVIESVPILDRGLQYGDGLFETIAVFNGRIRHFALHQDRLRRGCERLGLPLSVLGGLRAELMGVAEGRARAVLKLIITRGDGQRGYRAPDKPCPRRLLGLADWPSWPRHYYTKGVCVRVCRTRLGLNPLLAGIKHLNRLEQVLARSEWRSQRWQEGLMLDIRHRVVSGTMTNVFVRRGQRLLTPRIDECGVAGTMRAAILQRAPVLGWPVEQQEMTLDDIAAGDELFLSNALLGVWPVKRLGELRLRAGPAAAALIEDMKLREGAS